MKRVSSVLAYAISAVSFAALATPALAQDSAKIEQFGEGSQATIEQISTSGNNSAALYQGMGWYSGYGNQAYLMQRNVDGSQVEVFQSGSGNFYQVSQYDGSNLSARINVESSWYGEYGGGNDNQVLIEQSGYDSLASVEQTDSAYSRAEIWQNGMGWGGGGGNRADILQRGTNNQASIQQFGSNFSASIVQYGHGNGYGNSATIRQSH